MTLQDAIQIETLAIALYESDARHAREVTRTDRTTPAWLMTTDADKDRYRNRALSSIQSMCP